MFTPDRYPPQAEIVAANAAIDEALRTIGTWASRAQRDLAYTAALQSIANAMGTETRNSHLAEFRTQPSVDTKRAHLRDNHGQEREAVRHLGHPALNRLHAELTEQAELAEQ
jgi:hypothetical protein